MDKLALNTPIVSEIFAIFILLFAFRLKDVAQQQYSHAEAEWAAGKAKEILPKVRISS
jgi:hypothetical protein